MGARAAEDFLILLLQLPHGIGNNRMATTKTMFIKQPFKDPLSIMTLLAMDPTGSKVEKYGPNMSWEIFREEYTNRYHSTLRPKSAADADSRLDVAERILKPKLLSDVANRDALESL